MVDPPTYRAEPDPEFADRLERVLLQRLTAPGRTPLPPWSCPERCAGRTDTDPDDQEGDIIMLETEDAHGPRAGDPPPSLAGPLAPGGRRGRGVRRRGHAARRCRRR